MITVAAVGNAMAASTHYIAANGSDSNNGTSKTTPWAHLPGMPNCSANCASYSPAAGDQFIFRGGDTWHHDSLGIAWGWSGTSTNRIYIGVDQTWYSGASWTRPILTCDGQDCADNIAGMWTQIWVWADYVTIDNLELTGLYVDGSGDRHAITWGNGVFGEIKNNYVHGWYRGASGGGEARLIGSYLGGGTDVIRGLAIHDNVIDGSDATGLGKTGMAIYSGAYSIYNNIVRYVYNGINGGFNRLYGNVVEHVDFYSTSGDHCNGIYQKGRFDTSETTVYEYNNVVRDSLGDSCVYWYVMNNENCASCTTYFYNNLVFNVNGSLVGLGGDPGNISGTAYFYNSTIVSYPGKSDNCIGGSTTENQGTAHYANIHCITGAGSIAAGANTKIDDAPGHSRLETLASAASNGYCEPGVGGCTATYPFAPTRSASPTVGTGAAQSTSVLSTFGSALGYDTTLAVGYDTVNHKVAVSEKTAFPRGSIWDIGAYEFVSVAQGPAAPTSLQAAVH